MLQPSRSYSPGIKRITIDGFEPILQRYLQDTMCSEEVVAGRSGDIRLEKTATNTVRYGFGGRLSDSTTVGAYAEAFILLPIFGLPIPGRADSDVAARLYVDGKLSRSFAAAEQFPYWTTIYTSGSDWRRASEHSRHLVFRELATEVAAHLCR
jgi:hypothetical protein